MIDTHEIEYGISDAGTQYAVWALGSFSTYREACYGPIHEWGWFSVDMKITQGFLR